MSELNHDIKKLTSLINTRLSARAGFCNEFAQLRALLRIQLVMAETLGSALPGSYSLPIASLPVAVPGFNKRLLEAKSNSTGRWLPCDG